MAAAHIAEAIVLGIVILVALDDMLSHRRYRKRGKLLHFKIQRDQTMDKPKRKRKVK